MAGRTKVLVVGGGPAGSVAATALAQQGLQVRLLESARFPRYHIGESLTPSCRAVLDAIGVAETLDNHGFVIKHGGAFRWDSDSWVFDWGKQVGGPSRNRWGAAEGDGRRLRAGHHGPLETGASLCVRRLIHSKVSWESRPPDLCEITTRLRAAPAAE